MAYLEESSSFPLILRHMQQQPYIVSPVVVYQDFNKVLIKVASGVGLAHRVVAKYPSDGW